MSLTSNSHPTLRLGSRVSRAPIHHTLPAFLNLHGSSKAKFLIEGFSKEEDKTLIFYLLEHRLDILGFSDVTSYKGCSFTMKLIFSNIFLLKSFQNGTKIFLNIKTFDFPKFFVHSNFISMFPLFFEAIVLPESVFLPQNTTSNPSLTQLNKLI